MIDEKLKHIAIIMDGNGRWAQARGLSRSMGHKEGSKTLENIALHACDIGLKYLSVYAFSTDNFKRSQDEVDYLMNLFVEMFNKNYKKLIKKGIKVVFSGSKDNLRSDVVKAMEKAEEDSKNNTVATLNVCLNYGSQEEIIRASEKYHDDLIAGKITKEEMNRDLFYKYMDNDLPPVDILIRTGGEKILSNFMLYQLMYAEMYFLDVYFPDFTPDMLDEVIDNFYGRDRRFGGINEKKRTSWFNYSC